MLETCYYPICFKTTGFNHNPAIINVAEAVDIVFLSSH